MKKLLHNLTHLIRMKKLFIPLVILTVALLVAGVVYADVLDRTPPRGTVPNPGTQQQELANITFPAPYNVFEFVVTCAGCHGGGIDQNAGHFSNWAGSSMGSAARDPVFRANQIAVTEKTALATCACAAIAPMAGCLGVSIPLWLVMLKAEP